MRLIKAHTDVCVLLFLSVRLLVGVVVTLSSFLTLITLPHLLRVFRLSVPLQLFITL